MKPQIKLKRVYEVFLEADGYRMLVDRLWPRGLSKQKAAFDLWAKELAPSSELRKWFHHDPERWQEFRKRYLRELKGKKEQAREYLPHPLPAKITLLYAAKDPEHNHAQVLREFFSEIIPDFLKQQK